MRAAVECLTVDLAPWAEGLLAWLGWHAPDPMEWARAAAEILYPTDPAERMCR